jgi:predicted phosphohydrolase
MKRVLWLTDLHLNFVEHEATEAFLSDVARREPDGVLVSGDIAEARDVDHYLTKMAEAWPFPIYFVLGNHDFYFGSIREVRDQVRALGRQFPQLYYLTGGGPYALSEHAAVVGHDGWADARLGDYERSLVMMNDYRLIAELASTDKQGRWPLLHALGDEAAAMARPALIEAAEQNAEVFFVTHVPPFREACWHQGRLSDDEWLPHFSCQAMGEMIVDVMAARPNCRLTVLCGHTHGHGQYSPLPNVRVLTGGATYGRPQIQRMFEVA